MKKKSGKKIYAIIGARGGSKGISKKNIYPFGGFPLIAYSIAVAKLSKNIDRVIVSTDSAEIAGIAKKFGAEVPFLRPAEFATDKSKDIDFVMHVLNWLKENEGVSPEYLVHLRPTTPLRRPADIDEALHELKKDKKATSLRSGHEIRESPYKLFGVQGKYFSGLFPKDERHEYWNLPRQAFPPVYQPDGYIDILIPEFIKKNSHLHGPNILAYSSPDTGEIDKLEDFHFTEYNLKKEVWEVYEYLKKNFGDKK